MSEVNSSSDLGILIPMLKNRWRLVSISGLDDAEIDLLMLQLVRLKYRFKTTNSFGLQEPHDLFILVEETGSQRHHGNLAPIISKMAKMPTMDIVVANLEGDTTIVKTTTFKDARLLGYDYDLDYSSLEACQFPLEFTCDDIIYN